MKKQKHSPLGALYHSNRLTIPIYLALRMIQKKQNSKWFVVSREVLRKIVLVNDKKLISRALSFLEVSGWIERRHFGKEKQKRILIRLLVAV